MSNRINKKRLATSTAGREGRPIRGSPIETKTRKRFVFGASKYGGPHASASQTFFYPDCHCRPRSCTGSCHWKRCASSWLVGFTTDREFHPAPKVDIQLGRFYH